MGRPLMRAGRQLALLPALLLLSAGCGDEGEFECAAPIECLTSDGLPGLLPCPDGATPSECIPTVVGRQRFDTAGGIANFGGVAVTVPFGALEMPVELSAGIDASAPPPPVPPDSFVYRFEPAGTTFKTPITVSFPLLGSGAPTVWWTTAEDPSAYAPLPTRYERGRAIAQVTHFSHGFLSLAAAPGDAGADVGPDGGVGGPDGGEVGVGPDGGSVGPDGGSVGPDGGSVGPDGGSVSPDGGSVGPDGGSVSPDGGDVGIDAGADAGDAGIVLPPLTILTSSVVAGDSCVTRTQRIRASRSSPLRWRLLDANQLRMHYPSLPAPTQGVSIDASTGVLTASPVPLGLSQIRGLGIEVTDPRDGAVATAGFNHVRANVGAYAQGGSGSPIFNRSVTVQTLRSTVSSYSYQVAPAASAHPCQIRYQLGLNCTAYPVFDILQSGEMVTNGLHPSYTTNNACVQLEAIHTPTSILLDTLTYTFDIQP